MIAWGILWFLILCTTILLIMMEIINGSLPWRFWVCVGLIFIIIIMPIFTIGDYKASKDFYDKYQVFYEKVTEQELTPSQEYMILGRAMEYNRYLYVYQTKIKHWGILAPVYSKIKGLEPIQLTGFDMNNYRWWE